MSHVSSRYFHSEFIPGQDERDPVLEWGWLHQEPHDALVDFCGRKIPKPASNRPGSQYSPFYKQDIGKSQNNLNVIQHNTTAMGCILIWVLIRPHVSCRTKDWYKTRICMELAEVWIVALISSLSEVSVWRTNLMPCLISDTQCTIAETWTIHTQTEHRPSLSNLPFRHVSSLR